MMPTYTIETTAGGVPAERADRPIPQHLTRLTLALDDLDEAVCRLDEALTPVMCTETVVRGVPSDGGAPTPASPHTERIASSATHVQCLTDRLLQIIEALEV